MKKVPSSHLGDKFPQQLFAISNPIGQEFQKTAQFRLPQN